MDAKSIVNKILEGSDIRKAISETSQFEIDDVLKSDFEGWWNTYVDDFATGFDDYEDREEEVEFNSDGTISFYGAIDGEVIDAEMFKDTVKLYGVVVGKDINVEKDSYTGGVKVTFLDMTPEEFIKKVF